VDKTIFHVNAEGLFEDLDLDPQDSIMSPHVLDEFFHTKLKVLDF
jgi:hypothetical protein